MLNPWVNPFTDFLKAARLEIQNIPSEFRPILDDALTQQFVKSSEDRSFVFDIVDRVQTLATSLDRLRVEQ
jgi:hypothetical protein